MNRPPPSWLHPGVRLIEAGRSVGWVEIAAQADAFEAAFRAAGGRAVLPPQGVPALVAALVAAERVGVELHLSRRASAETDGKPHGPGFAVLLETSGTTGTPKLIRHDFQRLRGRLRGAADPDARWLLAYEPAAFAGLQVILTALAAGATLVSAPGAAAGELARLAVRHAVTHISATPSFWRAFLLALDGEAPPLAVVTLGGEVADQPLLDRLAECFPNAKLRHIYALTEAGALFAVGDGQAGFPAAWLDGGIDGVGLRLSDGVLEVSSPRAMLGYGDGWLSTGDVVEVRGDRALFAGRLDGRINVGGVKVSPEVVEQVLLDVPGVRDALVQAAANPVTGHILTALVVPAPGVEEAVLRAAIRTAVADLPPAARPRLVTMTGSIALGAAGKKTRKGTA
ncbi:AMP-binding protein (plasmid) [Azospirillum baldaniorum]|uniref:O-succinylbenzoyl-CoA ligase n=1 Tax=Azospirillum baldaniorum TaxID=1064539 RepID=A0A9P1JWI6_9PROT|nr:fatty acid--CoA ligase family protein [Azospirillum baldaniorum]AWJ91155.1 AMP-binding protein [Azospirillum baldaniorum]TWA84009.1 acyl-CoA synthetase (AMP-forming)/AMP-acid ligase II [Azospirillum brasilense]CCD01189.1 putative o-succinylbenzoyl-CoA ligase [Azospirillum baldaniorum]